MKFFFTILLVLSLSSIKAKAQSITCSELFSFVINNGYKKGEVGSITLYNSSWLKSVVAYQYKNSVFVIAEIKKDDYSFSTKKYIFCGIPPQNWMDFESYYVDSDLSYGEKFHKYIMDYKCDCD